MQPRLLFWDLLALPPPPTQRRKTQSSPPQPPVAPLFHQVWQSVRDWDEHSRGMLAGYLQAASTVVRSKQSLPGVAVHLRLGGSNCGGQGGRRGARRAGATFGSAGSYAVWALTTGEGAEDGRPGVVRVACSERAQTEIPESAIRRVQVWTTGRGVLSSF